MQDTGMPDHLPAANAFYDVSNPERRKLHRLYIRKCLDMLGDNSNVVYQISQEFTGPLPFVQFWIDTITEWENDTGKNAVIALGAPKNVQDAILADPVRAKSLDVLDLRYWWIQSDGTLFAPDGGREMPGRGLERGSRQAAESSPERIYEKVRSYRDRYPAKAIIDAIQGDRQQCLAFLMAGGGMLVRGGISYPGYTDPVEYIQPADVEIILPVYEFIRSRLSVRLPDMRPADIAHGAGSAVWALADDKKETILVYTLSGGEFSVDLTGVEGEYHAVWFDPSTGDIAENNPAPAGAMRAFTAPVKEDWMLLLKRKEVI